MCIKNDELCEHCMKPAKRPLGDGVPKTWPDGSNILPKKNKTEGVICGDCRWWNFEEFCQSQGVSPHNPVKHIP